MCTIFLFTITVNLFINRISEKKDSTHKNKVKSRYNNRRQRTDELIRKRENMISSFTTYINSDKCSYLTDDMKNVILNHLSMTIDDYDTIGDERLLTQIMLNHVDTTNKDYQKQEKRARKIAYMKAYENVNNQNNSSKANIESDIIFDQILKTLNEKEDVQEEDDPIMKNINDINELAAPDKTHDENEILKQKLAKVRDW